MFEILMSSFKLVIEQNRLNLQQNEFNATRIQNACSNGDIEEFKKYNDSSSSNKLIDYYLCVKNAVANNQLEMVKHLMDYKYIVNNEEIKSVNSQYQLFEDAAIRGNVEIVKYMLSNNYPHKIYLNSVDNHENIINILTYSSIPKVMKVIEYFIFEENFKPNFAIQQFIKHSNLEHIANMIEKRDLFKKLENEPLNNIEENNKPSNKVKI